MNLQENIQRINEIISNDKTNFGYVVFVSGLESTINHVGQTQIFTQNFTNKYPIKSFNYSNKNGIANFIKNNNIVAVILFSKGCELVSQINVPSQKIYCIEPWNGNKTDAGTAYRYSSIPAGNMYIDYEDFNRGNGTKKGANPTNHKNQHFAALASSSKSIAQKI
jgi:hypothetical protein